MNSYIVFSLIFFVCNCGEAFQFHSRVICASRIHDSLSAASNVSVNATWTFIDGINITSVVMTVYHLQSSQYAAMGLGQNQSMGEAHVFICKRFADDKIAIQRFINPGDHHPPVPAGSEEGGVFTPLPSKFMDGIVTCQFILSDFPLQIMKRPNTLQPLSQSRKYHPLFAVGLLNSTGDPQYHDGREPMSELVQLNQNQNIIFHQNSTKLFQ